MENKNVKEEVTMETLNSKLDDVIKGLILTSSMTGVFSDIVRSEAKGREVKNDKLLLSVLKNWFRSNQRLCTGNDEKAHARNK